MNLVGRLNIRLSEIVAAFPNAPNAAERDLQHRSSNLTFFRLIGTLALFGLLFATRHIAIAISSWLGHLGLTVGTGVVSTVLLIATLVTFWVVLVRRWRVLQNESPEMPQIQRSLVKAFQDFESLTKRQCPGIGDGLNDTRRVLLRIISQRNDTLFHRFVSQLIHLVRSDEFLELVAGKAALEASLSSLNSALVMCLEGKELLPLQPISASTQQIEAFNPVTTQSF